MSDIIKVIIIGMVSIFLSINTTSFYKSVKDLLSGKVEISEVVLGTIVKNSSNYVLTQYS